MNQFLCSNQSLQPPVAAPRRSGYGLRMVPRVVRFRLMTLMVVAAAVGFANFDAVGQNPNSIIHSKHNLSISSPGSVHATIESDVCIFCHTPHTATGDGPLWNHGLSAATYTPYSSATLKAVVGQPTGASRLCLSCHDGTVALGMVNSRVGVMPMTASTMPAGANNFGTDLSADHPISFTYDAALVTADGNLRDPNTLVQEVRLDQTGQLQCTSCHDPHNNQYGKFLVLDNTASALCLSCHTMSAWAASSHAASTKPLPADLLSPAAPRNGVAPEGVSAKFSTVASAGCAGCHVPHAAGTRQELMRFSTPERNCLPCHNAAGPGQNVAADFNKLSAHPILVDEQSHRAQEDPINPPTRHVTCADCHNPHASSSAIGSQARVSGALTATVGVSLGGSVVRSITRESELCYRCHGDSERRGPARVPRQQVETNTRREFMPGNTSFHPVEGVGKNLNAPSLILPLTASSQMTCSDCHNNDQVPANGGTGTKGPHGSAFVPLLERRLLLTDGTPYNPANFALCYKCHSSSVVDSELATSWSGHRKHIEDYRAACTTCHDSHAATQPHLINFNTTYVQPLNGTLRYDSAGLNHGVCTLTCHDGTGQNQPHNARRY